MAAVPGKRTFAEAMVSAADAVEGMDKLIDFSDGKYTEDDKKKDVKLVLRELNSFRKEVGPDRGEAREGTRTANARAYHSIVRGPHKYHLDEPLGDGWDSISAARGALLKTCGAWTSAVSGLRIGDTRKMSYHVLAGANADQVKAACLVKVNNEDDTAYIYWYKDAEDAALDEWVRIQAAFNSHSYAFMCTVAHA